MKPFSPSYNGASTISEASFVPSRCRIRHVVWHCLIVLSEAIDPRVRSCLVSFCLSSTRLRNFRLYSFPFSVRKRNHPPPLIHRQTNKHTHKQNNDQTKLLNRWHTHALRDLHTLFFPKDSELITHTRAVFLFYVSF